MDRLFLDANVLFSAAYRPGALLRRLWRLSGAELLTSSYATVEARRNLREDRQREDLEELLASVAPGSQTSLEIVQLPQKDVPILLAAVATGATHLITGDFTHFGPYYGESVSGVLILSPAQYLRGSASSED